MGLGPRLDLRQSQQLVMTPQLQQAIRLLALNNLEVEAFIAEEIERNPLLEVQSEGDDSPGVADAEERGSSYDVEGDDGFGESDAGAEPLTADRLIETGSVETDAPLDVDYTEETYHHDSPSDSVPDADRRGSDGALGLDGITSSGGGDGAPGNGFEELLVAGESLHDHLHAQAGLALSGQALFIATHLIDLIDESGYLAGDLADVADRLGLPPSQVEDVLKAIQGFEPSGVGARSLGECLAIQAREADRYDPAMARMLDNLELLARGDLAGLRRICGVDQEDLADMIQELRAYNPKPGLQYGGERIQHVVPDVFVARTREGWAVELNAATLPKVLVSRHYYAELSGGRMDKAHKAYLSECLASANWLVKALDQRARTIVKVASAIVTAQEAFFTHGVSHLRPLTLRQVAEEVGMHESTVSRVTSNKFLSCERGLFELKYFFTSGIQSADGGDAVSAHAVKDRIRALITAEEPKAVLSDDKLVEMLREEGFDIARRTVAKYREALGIGSSVQRRRQKMLQGVAG